MPLTRKQEVQIERVRVSQGRRAADLQKNNYLAQDAGDFSRDRRLAVRQRNEGRRGPGPVFGPLNRNQRPNTLQRARRVAPGNSANPWYSTPATRDRAAPTGHGWYDAFSMPLTTLATPMSIGPATPIESEAKHTIETPQGATFCTMIIAYPSASATQFQILSQSSGTPTGTCGSQGIQSPQLQASPPKQSIPIRQSIRLVNSTPLLQHGGLVHVLRASTGIFMPYLNSELTLLADHVRQHARTRTYQGSELGKSTFQINAHVNDASRAMWFKQFGAKINVDNIPGWPSPPPVPGVSSVGQMQAELMDPSYTPVIFVFDAVAGGAAVSVNSWMIDVKSQFLGRYDQGSMLANLAVNVPAHGDAMNKVRDAEESKGSTLSQVGHAFGQAARFGAKWAGPVARLALGNVPGAGAAVDGLIPLMNAL
jgi:hypothetical protein